MRSVIDERFFILRNADFKLITRLTDARFRTEVVLDADTPDFSIFQMKKEVFESVKKIECRVYVVQFEMFEEFEGQMI